MKEFQIGTFIKKRRKELGISQQQLCTGLCSMPTISRVENNVQIPNRRLTRNLLERLGVSSDPIFALWGSGDIDAGAFIREIRANLIKYRKSAYEDRDQIKRMIQEELVELEKIADPDDLVTRQFLLSHRAILGEPGKVCNGEERLAMQLEAIRLTCPQFDPIDFSKSYFTMGETTLINQIANTYAAVGERKRAIDIYRQLLSYIEKNHKELDNYPNQFCLISQNYSIDLTFEKHYIDAIKVAERGRIVCLKFTDYQFLPGFLAVQAECFYFLGELEKSKKLYLQAYSIYEAFEDESNMKNMRREMSEYLGLEILPTEFEIHAYPAGVPSSSLSGEPETDAVPSGGSFSSSVPGSTCSTNAGGSHGSGISEA
ncbi:MAG: helix-turn-helix domain-containing protein [Oscillibacter sp.]|nr:helix-turn-helix domain-containing protein [Oscillibacter sp.]